MNKTFDNLGANNFWEDLAFKCPTASKIFMRWLVQYKLKVKWKTMFFKTSFFDMPVELQYGIMLQFICEFNLTDVVYMVLTKNQKRAIDPEDFRRKTTNLFQKLEKQKNG